MPTRHLLHRLMRSKAAILFQRRRPYATYKSKLSLHEYFNAAILPSSSSRRNYRVNLEYEQKYTSGEANNPMVSWEDFKYKNKPYSPGRGADVDNQNRQTPYEPPLHFGGLPILHRSMLFGAEEKVLVHDEQFKGTPFTYMKCLTISSMVHDHFVEKFLETQQERVVFMCGGGIAYVASLWGSWSSGSVAVPLCPKQSLGVMRYILEDADPSIILYDDPDDIEGKCPSSREGIERLLQAAQDVNMSGLLVRFQDIVSDAGTVPNEKWMDDSHIRIGEDGFTTSMDQSALILYTSGATTGVPKGVVLSHRIMYNQIIDLYNKWGWKEGEDRFINVLPLNHYNGVIHNLITGIWAGAACEFMNEFDPHKIWLRMADDTKPPLTVFIGTPVIYSELLKASEDVSGVELERAVEAIKGNMKMMVSCSGPIPTTFLRRWKRLTGQVILEHYSGTGTSVYKLQCSRRSYNILSPSLFHYNSTVQVLLTFQVIINVHAGPSYPNENMFNGKY